MSPVEFPDAEISDWQICLVSQLSSDNCTISIDPVQTRLSRTYTCTVDAVVDSSKFLHCCIHHVLDAGLICDVYLNYMSAVGRICCKRLGLLCRLLSSSLVDVRKHNSRCSSLRECIGSVTAYARSSLWYLLGRSHQPHKFLRTPVISAIPGVERPSTILTFFDMLRRDLCREKRSEYGRACGVQIQVALLDVGHGNRGRSLFLKYLRDGASKHQDSQITASGDLLYCCKMI